MTLFIIVLPRLWKQLHNVFCGSGEALSSLRNWEKGVLAVVLLRLGLYQRKKSGYLTSAVISLCKRNTKLLEFIVPLLFPGVWLCSNHPSVIINRWLTAIHLSLCVNPTVWRMEKSHMFEWCDSSTLHPVWGGLKPSYEYHMIMNEKNSRVFPVAYNRKM